MSDGLDVALLKKGDNREFEKLVLLCQRRVYNIALRYTNNEQDAFDVSQEVFLRVFRALPEFKGDAAPSTWVYRITVNTAIDLMRKKKRRGESSLNDFTPEDNDGREREIADETFSPEAQYERADLRSTLSRAIAELPEAYRSVIVMRDVNGMSYREIGEVLGLEEGTVKSRIFRARDKLRSALDTYGNYLPGTSSNV